MHPAAIAHARNYAAPPIADHRVGKSFAPVTFLKEDRMIEGSSPARLYALIVGAVLVVAGIIGFFYESSFHTGNLAPRADVLGLLTVNGWDNLMHLITGLLGLAAAGYAARAYALGLGAVYLVVAVLGFAAGSGDEIFGLIVVNTADNMLHLVLGAAGVLAGLATAASAKAPARAVS
jgi:hypothetical protein